MKPDTRQLTSMTFWTIGIVALIYIFAGEQGVDLLTNQILKLVTK